MQKQIVIALYNENIEWINKLNNFDIYIYHKNKGIPKEIEKLVNSNKIYYEEIPNVGRESHTYIYHIIKNYKNLPNKIFFTQAEPFDHIDKYNEKASVDFFINKLNDFFDNDFDFKGYGKKHYIWKTGIGNKTETMQKLYSNLINGELQDHYFNNGGIFGVKKEIILNRSLNFYNECLKYLDYDKNPVEGFCFERLWSIIFNKNYNTKI